MFYLVCKDVEQRSKLIAYLKSKDILSVFHYLSLHSSPYYKNKHDGRSLSQSDRYTDTLVRLPFYYELTDTDMQTIINEIKQSLA